MIKKIAHQKMLPILYKIPHVTWHSGKYIAAISILHKLCYCLIVAMLSNWSALSETQAGAKKKKKSFNKSIKRHE